MDRINGCRFLRSASSARVPWLIAVLAMVLSLTVAKEPICLAYDLSVEGDLLVNGLAASPAVNGTPVDPSLNPPINWAFAWGDVAGAGAVSVPGGTGIGTDVEVNVVDIGGAGAGGGGLDGALAFAMDASAANHLAFNASTYEMAVKLTVHGDHANVADNGGVPGTQSIFRLFLKDYDGVDPVKALRAQEDIIYDYDITNVARDQVVELVAPLDAPAAYYHDPPNGVGDSMPNFDLDDPLGAGTGGAFELQLPVHWASHGRFHVTIHEIAIRERVASPGDFDDDGDVDGNDFLVWQRDDFSVAGLADWKANFGTGASQSPAAAVPEPCGLLLGAVAIAGLSFVRRRRPSH
jgi:hypothetical protein